MKLLEKEFVKNCEGVGDTTFKQMKKQESNGLNVYIYNRTKEGFDTYEVFVSKRRAVLAEPCQLQNSRPNNPALSKVG